MRNFSFKYEKGKYKIFFFFLCVGYLPVLIVFYSVWAFFIWRIAKTEKKLFLLSSSVCKWVLDDVRRLQCDLMCEKRSNKNNFETLDDKMSKQKNQQIRSFALRLLRIPFSQTLHPTLGFMLCYLLFYFTFVRLPSIDWFMWFFFMLLILNRTRKTLLTRLKRENTFETSLFLCHFLLIF